MSTTVSTTGVTTGAVTTSSGSTTYGHLEPQECSGTKIYVCRVDESGQCGSDSQCEYNYVGACMPGECSEACQKICSYDWECVASTEAMLICANDRCDRLAPDDCPEGMKCMPYATEEGSSWNAHKCFPVDPAPVGPGEVCIAEGGASGIDNCDADSMCWDVDVNTGVGVCIALCTGTFESLHCPPGTRCALTEFLNLCLPDCDPLLQEGCSGDDICVVHEDSAICLLDQSGEKGGLGDPCEKLSECDPGYHCNAGVEVPGCDAQTCCTPYCDVRKPELCPKYPDVVCAPFYPPGEAPPGSENLGYCRIAD